MVCNLNGTYLYPLIINRFVNLQIRTNITEASGFLVDGCPEDYVNRNQYDQLDSCKGLSGSLDPALNSTIAARICNHDSLIDPEMGSSVSSVVEMLDTLKNITDYYFILDLQKAMCLTQK